MSFTDLPFINEIIDVNVLCPVCNDKKCKCGKALSVKERSRQIENMFDPRLKNWELWLERRKKVHEKLCKSLNREPGDLVMNTSDEIRKLNEVRLRNYYKRLYKEQCPTFWKFPANLKPPCPKSFPVYYSTKTKIEKCELPYIDYVRTPNEIMKNKNVLPRSRFTISREMIGKERSELGNLAIIGEPIWNDLFPTVETVTEEISEIEQITEKEETHAEAYDASKDEPKERFYLKINDLEISPSSKTLGTRKVYVMFDFDVRQHENNQTQYLRLENKGLISIRYYWIPCPKYKMFSDIIPEKPVNSLFFFNKNEGVLLPDTTYDLPIWFKTDKTGTYCEQWELRFKPATFTDSLKLIVVMHATAYRFDDKIKIELIEKHIADNIRGRLIEECLAYVFPKRKKKDEDTINVFTYDRKEIFEAVNMEYTPCDEQIIYVYNKEIVDDLEDLYNEVMRPVDPQFWNLRVSDLRKITKLYDIRNEATDRRTILNEFDQKNAAVAEKELEKKEKFREKLEENKKKILNKYGIAVEDEENIKDEEPQNMFLNFEETTESFEEETEEMTPLKLLKESKERNRYTKYFNWLIGKLEKRVTVQNTDLEVFNRIYSILCTYFDIIGQKIEQLDSVVHVEPIRRRTSEKGSSFESTDIYAPLPVTSFFKMPEWHVEKTIFVPREPPPSSQKFDKPPPESLQDIPMEECKKRYKTYYNLPMTPPPSAKTKDAKGDKKTKASKSDKESKKDATAVTKKEKEVKEPDDGYVVDPKFDPFIEDFPTEIIIKPAPVSEIPKSKTSVETVELPNNISEVYKHNIYVIFYYYISQAIDDISEALTIFGNRSFSLPQLKEIYESKQIKNKKLINIKKFMSEKVGRRKSRVTLKREGRRWYTQVMEEEVSKIESRSSLWSILHDHEPVPIKPDKIAKKPISYPETLVLTSPRITPTVAKSTSTMEGGVLDTNFVYVKEVAVQKNYRSDDVVEDLEEYIEKPKYVSSPQSLHYDLCKCQDEESKLSFSDTDVFLTSESSISKSDAKSAKSVGAESVFIRPDTCGDGDKCINPNCRCKF